MTDTFAYIDDVTICGRDQKKHDDNFERFLKAAKRKNLTLNDEKSTFSTRFLHILSYVVGDRKIESDPERIIPLRKLPPPTDSKSQKRVVGIFAYYSQWIRNFSDKIRILVHNSEFPFNKMN